MTFKPGLSAALLTLSLAASLPAWSAQVDVGVSIQISQPGVYGRIDIGRYPQPQVIETRPILIAQPRVVVVRPQPVYMWVPPGHRKNWRKHCAAYGACATPVVFVRDDWYDHHVQPHGQQKGKGYDKGRDKGHGKKHDKDGHGHD
jgi:hypothetical protein